MFTFLSKERLVLISLIVIFVIMGFISSLTAPFAEGPDEVAHFYVTRFIAKHGRLPITARELETAGYKSDLPPLFYLIAGASGRFIDLDEPPFVKISWNNPRLQLVFGLENVKAWRALTTEDPYQSEVLLWYWARWVSLLSGLAGLIGAYFLIRAVQPDCPWLAILSAALLGFLPIYLSISSVISYEPLVGALLAFYFWLIYQAIQAPRQKSRYFMLGLLVGMAGLTRQTAWPAMLLLPILLLWLASVQAWPRRAIWSRLALACLGISFTFGWWMLYRIVYFNRVEQFGLLTGLLHPFLVSDGSDTTSLHIAELLIQGEAGAGRGLSASGDTVLDWAWSWFRGIWGQSWLASIFIGLWGLALVGVVRRWPSSNRQTHFWLAALALHIGVFILLSLLRFLFLGQASATMPQHILFPAGSIMMVLLLYGLRPWLQPGQVTWLLSGLVVLYGILAGLNIIRDSGSPWPIQTVPLEAGEPLLADFKTISLIGYLVDTQGDALDATLQWRAEEFSTEDYQIEITLVDTNGQSQARWLGQPLNGRYPTRAWSPGDRVRQTISLPVASLPGGDYQVQLRVLGEAGPLPPSRVEPVEVAAGAAEQDSFVLDRIRLDPAPPKEVERAVLNDLEVRYAVWPGSGPPGEEQLYREYATILVWVSEPGAGNVRVSLVGPFDQVYAPIDYTGHTINFSVRPDWAGGAYRLRFERVDRAGSPAAIDTKAAAQVETEARQFDIGPISHPVQANFAGQIALLGYDLPARVVEPGERLDITLHWQALKKIGANLIIFNHLVDDQQQIWGGRDRLAREIYSTLLWAPGEIVSDAFAVQVDPEAPDGIYWLLVGLYLPVGQASVSAPLVENGQLTDVTHVRIGPVKVGDTPPGYTLEQAEPQVRLDRPLGDAPNVTLLGYDLAQEENGYLDLTLYWRSEAPLAVDYTAFVHLRNEAGETVAQRDRPPLAGAYPTSLWAPGEIIADQIRLEIPAGLPAGQYQIVTGLYDFQTGRRLAAPGGPANEMALAPVHLEP